MIDDLVAYRATTLVWAALGGGSLSLPYLEHEAHGPVDPRSRFYGFVNDAEFIAACQERGIKVFGIVFEAQGWEFPAELDESRSTILSLNELRDAGPLSWLGLSEFSSDAYPALWPSFETYFPGGLVNSDGERVTDLIDECVVRDIHQQPCRAHWVECPDRAHQCFYMDRNNPVWREYLKAVIRIQVDAGVDGVQLDEAELPLGALQYGACFCKDCMKGFRAYLAALPADRLPAELADEDLDRFHYGEWLLARGHDFKVRPREAPLFSYYYAYQCSAISRHFGELAAYVRDYARSKGRKVLVSGNFFNLEPHYLPLADDVDVIITEMRNTTYCQPEWYRYVDAFARYAGGKQTIVVENPYGGVVPELVDLLSKGRGHDLMRLSLYEAAAFGSNMSVPYGSWMGSRIEDAFYAPHDLLVEAQDFLADHEHLVSRTSANEVCVAYSTASNRELQARADVSDNVVNAHDESVVVPFREVTRTLARESVPFDVVILADDELAEDRFGVEAVAGYRTLVLPHCTWLTPGQAETLQRYLDGGGSVVASGPLGENLPEPARQRLLEHPRLRRSEREGVVALLAADPQVTVSAPVAVNLHRLDGGAIAVHLVNYAYDEGRDAVDTLEAVTLRVRTDHAAGRARVIAPGQGARPVATTRDDGMLELTIDALGPYAIVVID